MRNVALFCLLLPLVACSRPESTTTSPSSVPAAAGTTSGTTTAAPAASTTAATVTDPWQRNAYFGDLHVHTRYSFDAFTFGTAYGPDDAYRYAKGDALQHPAGFEMKLAQPLDFYAVTDHAMFLGMMPAMADPSTEVSKLPAAKQFATAKTVEERRAAFQSIFQYLTPERANEILDMNVVRSAWQDTIAAAERHNDPGKFTTFIAYEYTSGPDNQNLHRNVIFEGSRAAELPYSRLDSQNPEDLWRWMDGLRGQGIESLAIPHNSNGSNGQMFKLAMFADDPLSADYAALRMRNEPLVEITQVKGTSDTHPLLSPNDEWAKFEIFPFRIATQIDSNVPGSYVREALLNGIQLQDTQGFNPFQFGLVGASDTHNAATSAEENNFFSKVGLLDGTAERRGSVPLAQPGPNGEKYAPGYYHLWGAAGLTGVWADGNRRDSIYAAFRRKETFATTGTRMRVRFFAGYGYTDDMLTQADLLQRAYQGGVPMGADLTAQAGKTPRFIVWAMRGADGAPLQRVQVVKGWVDGGKSHERVYDVACSDGLAVDASTQRCPDNGAKVDLTDCSISSDKGAAELQALWSDPEFNSSMRAVYYVRVLENPSCRWSTWDAVRAKVAPRAELPATIQERAWSSPIWYAPSA